jgi:hypothetical protein
MGHIPVLAVLWVPSVLICVASDLPDFVLNCRKAVVQCGRW